MPYNNLISRTEAQPLIPEQVAAVMEGVTSESAALRLFPNVRVPSNQTRIPVISVLPTAYFVSGDTGLKQTTEVNWANVYLNVEEIAAIVPIPEAVLDDSEFGIWDAVRPRMVEAIGRTLDAAIFFGVNKPASWPTDIVAAAIAAGNARTRGTATAAQGGIAEDVNQLMGTVEADGYRPRAGVGRTSIRAVLRSARDSSGQALLDVSDERVLGLAFDFDRMPGLWPTPAVGAAEAIIGDFAQGVLGIRQDISMRLLDQAVITDNTGAVIYNLPQQDMLALRVVFRVGWQVPNIINWEQQTAASRYPFAVLRQA